MADRMLFPVGFDFETARKEAEKTVGDMLKRIQDILKKEPVQVHVAADEGGLKSYEKAFKSTIDDIKARIKSIREEWSAMSNEIKFDKSGDLSERSKSLIRDFTQLTEVLRRYGLSLEEASRQAIKLIDDEAKAEQKKVEEFRKTEAQITRDRLAQIEARRKAEIAAMNELEKRYADQQRMYNQLFAKIDIPKGIDAGFVSDGSNDLLGKRLAQYNALRKVLDEINREFARIQAIGAAYNKQGEPTERVIPLLERRMQIEQKIASITRTAAEAQKMYAKQQAEAVKEEERALREKQAADAEWVRNYMANREKEAQAHARRIQQIQAEIAAQAKLKAEMQAMYNELFTRAGQKGINVGFIDTSKTQRDVAYLQDVYRTTLADLQRLEQVRTKIKIQVDDEAIKMVENEIYNLERKIKEATATLNKNAGNRLVTQQQLQIIQQLRQELDKLQKSATEKSVNLAERLFGSKAINAEYDALKKKVDDLYNAMIDGQRKVASERSANEALGRQIEKVEQLRAKIAELDAQYARLNAQGGAMTASGRATPEALGILNERKKAEEEIAKITQTAEEAQRQAVERTGRARELWAQRAREQAEKRAKEEEDAAKKQEAHQAKANVANQKQQASYNAMRRSGLERQRILKAQENTIAAITAKLQIQQQRLQSTALDSKKFERIAAEVERLTKALEEARKKMAQASGQNFAPKGIEKATREFQRQTTYVERLIKRMAVYASFGAVAGFLTKVREVTAQFELQRVSLGAIIQDQTKANALFSEIKQFALKSPVSIMDLTKYTKQVAAYRIETDKLFDTTKMLADVAVGLGVSMDRIVLAFGQTRATGWLRASEIRQFTEAGIPLVEMLAQNLSKANGELVTAAQVMDMVQKRMISFDQVEQVFKDMTSAGGIFYNMQEKQGNTLYGMWAKLGDAASVMYDQIGNTEYVNKGMKSLIEALTELMRNWKFFARQMLVGGIAVAVMVARYKMLRIELTTAAAIQNTYNTRMTQANTLMASGNKVLQTRGLLLSAQAKTLRGLSMLTNAFGVSLRQVGTVIASIGFGAIIMGVSYLIDKLFISKTKLEELKDSYEEIVAEMKTEQDKSIRNFSELANVAVDPTKNYQERKEAMDELVRTYKDILPQEVLEIDYLKSLNGNYDSVNSAIRNYIELRQRQKLLDTAAEKYGADKMKYERQITSFLEDKGWNENEIKKFWIAFYKGAEDEKKTLEDVVRDAVKAGGFKGAAVFKELLSNVGRLGYDADKELYKKTGSMTLFGGVDTIDLLLDITREQKNFEDEYTKSLDRMSGKIDTFGEKWTGVSKKISENPIPARVSEKTGITDAESYEGMQTIDNEKIKEMNELLKKEFELMGQTWQDGFSNIVDIIDKSKPEIISSLDFDAIFEHLNKQLNNPNLDNIHREYLTNLITFVRNARTEYNKIVPDDTTVRAWQARFKMLANSFGGFKDKYKQYLMQAGEDLETYNKRMKDSLEGLKNKVKGLIATQKMIIKAGFIGKILYGANAEEVQRQIDEYNEIIKIIEAVVAEQPSFDKPKKTKSGGGKKTEDPRLQNAQEAVSELEKIYSRYQELLKTMSRDKAMEFIEKNYAASLATLKKYGVEFKGTMEGQIAGFQKLKDWLDSQNRSKKVKGIEKFDAEMDLRIADVSFKDFQENIKKRLSEMSAEISKSKEAKQFFDKIFSETADYDLSIGLTMSIYGETGQDLQKQMAEQLQGVLTGGTDSRGNVWGVDIYAQFGDKIIDPNTFKVNYGILRDIMESMGKEIPEEQRKMLEDILKNGESFSKTQVEQWAKDLKQAENYATKTIKLQKETATQITAIEERKQADLARIQAAYERGDIDETEADAQRKMAEDAATAMIEGYQRRLETMQQDLDLKYLKDSPLFSTAFENLDAISEKTLVKMRERFEELRKTMSETLSPSEYAEFTKKIMEIDEQLAQRTPIKSLIKNWKEYFKIIKKTDIRKAEEDLLNLDRKRQEEAENLKRLLNQREQAEKNLSEAMKSGDEVAEKMAKNELDLIDAEIDRSRKKIELIEKEKSELAELIGEYETAIAVLKEAGREVVEFLGNTGKMFEGLGKWSEIFGGDEEDVQFFNDIADGIGEITSGFENLISSLEQGNISGVIASAVSAPASMVSGFISIFTAGKVRKANKEIKRQQKLIDALEYSYSRLEEQIEKTFGSEYIQNYNERLKALQAQQAAYLKQAEAERSKGKKKDEDRLKEYEDAARDAADQILELQNELSSQFLGSDITSAARDFASAWLEAYREFGSTADAIKEKFQDMMNNLIVEGVLARVMQSALQPVYDIIDTMDSSSWYDENFWKGVASEMDKASSNMDAGAQTLMSFLEQAGLGLQSGAESLTGISRDIAGASEESINGLAVGINTQNFYIAQIHSAVLGIYQTLLAPSATASGSALDVRDLVLMQNEHLSQLPGIAQNTADTVARLEDMLSLLNSVIKPRTARSTFAINATIS